MLVRADPWVLIGAFTPARAQRTRHPKPKHQTLTQAQTAADKLLLLGWRGKGVEVDSGQLSTEALTALLSWLLRRVSGTGGQAAERKGEDGDPGSQLPRLLAAVARLGIIELDEAAVRGPVGDGKWLLCCCQLQPLLTQSTTTMLGALPGAGCALRPGAGQARNGLGAAPLRGCSLGPGCLAPGAAAGAGGAEGTAAVRGRGQGRGSAGRNDDEGEVPDHVRVLSNQYNQPHHFHHVHQAKRELAALCSSKRARVDELRRELSTLTHRLQETRQKASALEPLLSQPLAARVVSTTDTAARVAKLKTALQVLEEESRRLDVRIGVAHHLLLFSWQQGARDQAAEEGESLLLQAANGPEGGADDEDEDEDEPEE